MENIVLAWPAKLSHVEFPRQVTLCLPKEEEELQNRPDGKAELPQDARFDGMNHF